MRKNESEEVCAVFGPEGPYDLNFVCVNARQRFYDKLAGVEEPEQKRKIIGEEFIRVFEAVSYTHLLSGSGAAQASKSHRFTRFSHKKRCSP